MFTGIIEAIGKIESLVRTETGGMLRVSLAGTESIGASLRLGDSVAVNGCCLTVVEFGLDYFSADLSGETLRRTAFGEKKPGAIVNLERPLTAAARLGGHFVQGHVDGVGRVLGLAPEGENWWLEVKVPEPLGRYVVEKGSIAIDGISLTVAKWREGIADIAVIPFTYAHTNIAGLAAGDTMNLECDILAKYVENLMSNAKTRLTVGQLIEEGF